MTRLNGTDTMVLCDICGKDAGEYGNNAAPVKKGICCNDCNTNIVIPARLKNAGMTEEKISTTAELLRNSEARTKHQMNVLTEYKSIYNLLELHLKKINGELNRIMDLIGKYEKIPSRNRYNEVLRRLNKLKEHGEKLLESMTLKGNY